MRGASLSISSPLPLRPGGLQPGDRQLRLGREAHLLGDLGPGPTHRVVAPGLGQVPAPVQERLLARRGVGQGTPSRDPYRNELRWGAPIRVLMRSPRKTPT